jgi:hypothetical protein
MQANEDIELTRGDTLTLVFEYLGNLTGHQKVWFTLKDDLDDADAEAIIQIEHNAGLLYINGAAATVAGNGSLAIDNEAAGSLTVTLAAVESAKLPLSGRFIYDIQVLLAAGVVRTLSRGEANIIGDVARVTS